MYKNSKNIEKILETIFCKFPLLKINKEENGYTELKECGFHFYPFSFCKDMNRSLIHKLSHFLARKNDKVFLPKMKFKFVKFVNRFSYGVNWQLMINNKYSSSFILECKNGYLFKCHNNEKMHFLIEDIENLEDAKHQAIIHFLKEHRHTNEFMLC